MRRIAICILALLTVISFISCEAEQETASLRVEMNDNRRTLKPEEKEMSAYGYKVILVGPDGKESDAHYTYYSYLNIDGLNVGEWTVKVYGFNNKRKEISYGEKTIALKSGKNNISISLETLIGEGNLELIIKWDIEAYKDVKGIHTMFKSQDGKEIILTPSTPNNGQSTINYINLPSGSYTLQIELRDSGGKKLCGLTEAIRISNSTSTKGEIFFSANISDKDGNAEVNISDKTALPVEVTINGVESLIEADKSFTVSISISENSKIDISKLNTVWHLDGVEIGRGNEYTFDKGVSEGLHRLDVLTSTGENGSVGSSSITFQAASSTNEGDPYQKITIENGSQYYLGSNVVAHFLPNNNLVIASNQYRKLQLLSISFSTVKLMAEYDYSELSLDGDIVDFISSGESSDSYYSAIFLCNGTSSAKAVNLIISKDQITFNDEVSDFDAKGETNRACHFVNIAEGEKTFLATIESTDKTRMGYVYFNKNPRKGEMINRDECYIEYANLEYGYSGFKCLSSIASMGYFISASGQRAKIIESHQNSQGYASNSEYFCWVSWDDYISYYNQGKTKNEFENSISCGFLTKDAKFAYVLSEEGIYYYKDSRDIAEDYQQYNFESVEDGEAVNIKMCKDLKYGYQIDNKNKKLYTLIPTLSNGENYRLEKSSFITLDNKDSDTLSISDDGSLLALYNVKNAYSLTLIKTSR